MRTEATERARVDAQVVGYADGVYNVRLTDPDTGSHEHLEVSENAADRVCDLLGVELPDPDSTPPEQWG